MLRISVRRLAAALPGGRGISSSALVHEGEDKGPDAFLKEFMPKVASTVAPPQFPSQLLKPRQQQEEGAALPDKLTFNLFLPHQQHTKNAKACQTASKTSTIAVFCKHSDDSKSIADSLTGVSPLSWSSRPICLEPAFQTYDSRLLSCWLRICCSNAPTHTDRPRPLHNSS